MASFIGIAGFALLFNSSRRMAVIAATVGTAANILRLVLVEGGVHPQFAALVAGLLTGLIVVYICAGLAIARMLTDNDWAFGRLIDFSERAAGPPAAAGP